MRRWVSSCGVFAFFASKFHLDAKSRNPTCAVPLRTLSGITPSFTQLPRAQPQTERPFPAWARRNDSGPRRHSHFFTQNVQARQPIIHRLPPRPAENTSFRGQSAFAANDAGTATSGAHRLELFQIAYYCGVQCAVALNSPSTKPI